MKAAQFKQIRTKKNLTQQQMADLLGVKQQRVSGWEAGLRKIPKYILLHIQCLKKAKVL